LSASVCGSSRPIIDAKRFLLAMTRCPALLGLFHCQPRASRRAVRRESYKMLFLLDILSELFSPLDRIPVHARDLYIC
jgi:hypothetical protein